MENKVNVTYDMVEVSELLNIHFGNYKMGRNILFEYLRYFTILQDVPNKDIPFQEYYDKGYFRKIPASKL